MTAIDQPDYHAFDAKLMQEVLAASDDCIKIIDLDGKLLFMSTGGMRVMEIDDFGKVKGCPWPDFWIAEGNQAAKRAILAARAGTKDRFVGSANTGKGNLRWWDVQVSPILDDDRRPARILSISRDITGTKRAEEAALLAERRMKDTLKAGSLGYWELDLSTMILEASEICKFNFGRSHDQLFTYEDLKNAVHPDDQQRMQAAVAETITNGADYNIQYRITKPNGELAWVLIRAQLTNDETGKPLAMTGVSLDITDLKTAEELLARSEERLQLALGASSMVGIWDWDLRTNLIYADPNFAKIYTVSEERAAAGAPLEEYTRNFHPDDVPAFEAELRRLFDGHPTFENEYRILQPDGGVRWVHARGRLIKDSSGEAVRFSGASVEITDRKRAELTQKLLMNELAHRVKNTLSVVQALTSQTLRNSASLEDAAMKLQSRIGALANAHDVLVQDSWLGADLAEVVTATIRNTGMQDSDRIRVHGESVSLGPKAAMSFSLVLHEMSTNAFKYGALSNDTGRIEIVWDVKTEDGVRRLQFQWSEHGGPSVVMPERKGFGSRLVKASLQEFGEVVLDYAPEGVILKLVTSINQIEAGSHCEQ